MDRIKYKWFERDTVSVENERQHLRQEFPTLALEIIDDQTWVTGTLAVVESVAYTVNLLVPDRYPEEAPVLFCDPREIPWSGERHVFSKGRACLCVRTELRLHWPNGSDLADFLRVLVVPYFIGQVYFDAHGDWPQDSGERSHGVEGIKECYRELVAPIGQVTDEIIIDFARLLSRKNPVKGHELCPCGTGRRLRNCHREFVSELRERINPKDAHLDYHILRKHP